MDSAVKFYREHMKWREAEQMDEIRSECVTRTMPQQAYLSITFTPRLLDGLDFQGRPILFRATRRQLRGDRPAGPGESDLLRSYCRVMEDVLDAIKASKKPDGGCLKIYDFRHLTVLGSIRALSFAVRFGKLLEVNIHRRWAHCTLWAFHPAPSG